MSTTFWLAAHLNFLILTYALYKPLKKSSILIILRTKILEPSHIHSNFSGLNFSGLNWLGLNWLKTELSRTEPDPNPSNLCNKYNFISKYCVKVFFHIFFCWVHWLYYMFQIKVCVKYLICPKRSISTIKKFTFDKNLVSCQYL